MKKIILVSFLAFVFCALVASPALAVSSPQVQTNSPSNIQSISATLNGNLYDLGGYGSVTVWFEWGLTPGYGNTTNQTFQSYTGNFSQQISNLMNNQTYHYRAVAQNGYGTSYGQDMQFTTSQYGGGGGGSFWVQTNAATNVYSNQATLNGYVSGNYSYATAWFQWGATTAYGSETNHQTVYSGQFTQNITGLNGSQTYHYRAVAQDYYGNILYGQDMQFFGGYGGGGGGYGNSQLTVTKMVRNLSSGMLNWSTVASANPSDIIQFSVTVQAYNNQTVHNVLVRDNLPANLIYNGNLTIDGVTSYANISQGVNVGDLYYGQTKTITYQAQVANINNFSFGQTPLVNSVYVTSLESTSNNANATVYVTRSGVLGATTVSTGLTNNLLTDSFFLPLVLLIAGWWIWKSGALGTLLKKI